MIRSWSVREPSEKQWERTGFTHQPGLRTFSSLKQQRKRGIRKSGHHITSVSQLSEYPSPPHPRSLHSSSLGSYFVGRQLGYKVRTERNSSGVERTYQALSEVSLQAEQRETSTFWGKDLPQSQTTSDCHSTLEATLPCRRRLIPCTPGPLSYLHFRGRHQQALGPGGKQAWF